MKPKIELGKEYPTQSGAKGVVYRNDGMAPFNLIGAVYSQGVWLSHVWRSTGRTRNDGLADPDDLILPSIVMVPVEVPPDAVAVNHYRLADGHIRIDFDTELPAEQFPGYEPLDDWIASLEAEK